MSGLQNAEKIDIFTHILPPKYKKTLDKKAKYTDLKEDVYHLIPELTDVNARLRMMDKFEGLKHVLTVSLPALETVVDAPRAAELAKIANDEMAELVAKYPDQFAAAVACLPMNNIDDALAETDRAIRELNFKGVQINTPVNGKPLDSPEFMALYQKMCEYDLPIWIHPTRNRDVPDYVGEDHSKYGLFRYIGWLYETTAAMLRLSFSGVIEQFPGIKFVTHHCGAMIPFFSQRIVGDFSSRFNERELGQLNRSPLEYLHMFYGDTATVFNTPALMCGYAFFGPDHMVFGTDMPVPSMTDQTISAIESMDIPDYDKKKIFAGNAKALLRLPE